MAEYIEKKAVRKAVYSVSDSPFYRIMANNIADMVVAKAWKNIDAIPKANVHPVVRGEWKEEVVWDDIVFVCSNCGEPWTLIDGTPEQNNMNFCPNCGTDMRRTEDG